jgi:hypothetical protein
MTTQITHTNQLSRVIAESELATDTADYLLKTFGPPFEQASQIIERSGRIEVTDATQVSQMKAARTARLELRSIRVEAEKTRKAVKEDALRLCTAIDKVASVIPMLTEPEESRLESCEKFAELAEARRKMELRGSRVAALTPFNANAHMMALEAMTDDEFERLLATSRRIQEEEKAEAARAEAERIAREKARAEEDARIRAENERLRKELEEADRQRGEAERRAEKERRETEAKAAEERRRLQAEADAKLKAEREAREKLERESREREEAEKKRKAAEERARKKAAAAPDAEKLRTLARDLYAIKRPQMSTDEGTAALDRAIRVIQSAVEEIKALAENLE